MESLPLVHYPNKILKTACADVTQLDQEMVDFVHAMSQTMYSSHGIGLAAPQVGRNIKVVTVDVEQQEGKDTLLHLINPMIVDAHGGLPQWEAAWGRCAEDQIYGRELRRPLRTR